MQLYKKSERRHLMQQLPYKTEVVSKILIYHYDQHRWQYDCKFWLSEDKSAWVQIIDGKEDIVGYLTDNMKRLINNYDPIIKKREQINAAYCKHQKCRKRSCICKSCNQYCFCGTCDAAIKICKVKEKMQEKSTNKTERYDCSARDEMNYILKMSEKQAEIIQIALEEYFRLRMNQWSDFADDVAHTGYEYNPEDPDNSKKFDDYINRRNDSEEMFKSAMRIAQSGVNMPYTAQTEEMLISQDIWQVIRHQLYLDRGGDPNAMVVAAYRPYSRSGEALPIIEKEVK